MWLNTFNAYKELLYSKYIPNFLGYDTISDPKYNLFFVQYIKGKSLMSILENVITFNILLCNLINNLFIQIN